jgi:sporulation protein YlmC with PRC-barrel domain
MNLVALGGQGGTLTEQEMILPSHDLGGLQVYNRDNSNDKLGSLDNLIIDAHSGQVLYGVLKTGLLGKLIPVPWTALGLRRTPDTDNYWMVLNKTRDQLANAPTFDSKRTDFTNAQWSQSVDNFFGVHTMARPTGTGDLTANQMVFQSSHLSDLAVHNRADNSKKLGSLENLMINAHHGRVLYGILDTGMGGKKIAVPWNAFQVQKKPDSEKYWLTLNKTQDELAAAPAFDKNRVRDLTDSNWQQQIDRFFGVQPARQ